MNLIIMKTVEEFDKNSNQFITFYLGENAKDNDALFDQMSPDAFWIHLENFPSAHVYFELPKGKLAKKSKTKLIKFGGRLIKENSKYRKIQGLKICYTRKKNLRKSDVLGEVEIVGDVGIIRI